MGLADIKMPNQHRRISGIFGSAPMQTALLVPGTERLVHEAHQRRNANLHVSKSQPSGCGFQQGGGALTQSHNTRQSLSCDDRDISRHFVVQHKCRRENVHLRPESFKWRVYCSILWSTMVFFYGKLCLMMVNSSQAPESRCLVLRLSSDGRNCILCGERRRGCKSWCILSV